jgi:hypothetical protein
MNPLNRILDGYCPHCYFNGKVVVPHTLPIRGEKAYKKSVVTHFRVWHKNGVSNQVPHVGIEVKTRGKNW